jgi:uncharacterized damage-inducible protein DinB
MLSQSLLGRLSGQLDALGPILRGASDAALTARGASGTWSAHENLAHLARVQEVLFQRLDLILAQDRPALQRYRAEEDPEWPAWAALPPREALDRLRRRRTELLARVSGLTPEQARRTGVHSRFGEMDVADWLDFFLVHEAHHLYVVMLRLLEARQAGAAPASPPGRG